MTTKIVAYTAHCLQSIADMADITWKASRPVLKEFLEAEVTAK